FQEKVLPRLDEIFSTMVPEGIILRIPKMEIDLGKLDEAHWEREFIERSVERVNRQIQNLASRNEHEGNTKGVEWIQPEENAVAVLKVFLLSGVFPWYARHLSARELEDLTLKAARQNPLELRKSFSPELLQDRNVWQRLNWQFSSSLSTKMVVVAKDLHPDWFDQLQVIFEEQRKKTMTQQQRIRLLKALLAIEVQEDAVKQPTPRLLRQLTQLAFSEEGASFQETAPQNKQKDPKTSAVDRRQADDKINPNAPSPSPADKATEEGAEGGIPNARPDHRKQTQQANAFKGDDSQSTSASKEEKVPEEGLMVGLAGLVLLGVYLESFFKELDLLKEGHFETESKSTKAIHLLHYLATGEEHPEEPSLVLPKLLCGVPVETPLPKELRLLENEKKECSNLLEAAIRNWPALKRTSPGGLRDGFLKREGILYPPVNRSMWALKVEQKAQDLLLDRLPWGFAITKLPWMELPLQTEW
ncbi:MAG TPA: contractile injection system tape measure protein, partial [Phaeodactylibacter sp.]|nr:contractile injection system tape measure protein [Phaeodactylibacter sp.]